MIVICFMRKLKIFLYPIIHEIKNISIVILKLIKFLCKIIFLGGENYDYLVHFTYI